MNVSNSWTLRLKPSDYVKGWNDAIRRRRRNNPRTTLMVELARTLGISKATCNIRYGHHIIDNGKRSYREIPIDIAAKIVADDLERKLLKASRVKAKSLVVDKG